MNSQVKSGDILRIAAPLDSILADSSTSEIMIDRYDQVFVERGGQIEQVASPFSSVKDLQALIDRLFGLYGIELNETHPVGYLRLPDHSLVTAVLPPNAVDGPYMVLRRFVGPRLTWERLIEYGAVPQQARDLLERAVGARANILVSGGTGAGKITFANCIIDLCPPQERLVIVEQSYEMRTEHPRLVRLEAGGAANLGMEDLLVAATRMRPDRLIVGELTGPIAASVLEQFRSGYDGSLASIHGRSTEDALRRLESFCLMANLGLGMAEIRHLIASAIQLVTYQERLADGSRKLIEIVELCGIENQRYALQPLMRYDRASGQFEFTEVKPGWES